MGEPGIEIHIEDRASGQLKKLRRSLRPRARFRWRLRAVRPAVSRRDVCIGLTWSRQVDLSRSSPIVSLWVWLWYLPCLGVALVFQREPKVAAPPL